MRKVVYNACFGGFGLNEKALAGTDHKYDWNIKRHDPILVQVVEEGNAGHRFSDLRIAEVSDKYFINEYDGLETVVEPGDIEWQ